METNNQGFILFYKSEDGNTELNVRLEKDTVWLTQSQMANLFGVDRTVIVRHIRNIYKSEELYEDAYMKMQPVQKMHKFKKKGVERSEELYLIII